MNRGPFNRSPVDNYSRISNTSFDGTVVVVDVEISPEYLSIILFEDQRSKIRKEIAERKLQIIKLQEELRQLSEDDRRLELAIQEVKKSA